MDNNPVNLTDVSGDVTGDQKCEGCNSDGLSPGDQANDSKGRPWNYWGKNNNCEDIWSPSFFDLDVITINSTNKAPSEQKQEQTKTKWYKNILSNIKSFAISQFKKLTISKEKRAEFNQWIQKMFEKKHKGGGPPKEEKTITQSIRDGWNSVKHWWNHVDDGGTMVYGEGHNKGDIMGSNQGGHYSGEKSYEVTLDEFGGINSLHSIVSKIAFAKFGSKAIPYLESFYFGYGLAEITNTTVGNLLENKLTNKLSNDNYTPLVFKVTKLDVEQKVQSLKRDTIPLKYEGIMGKGWYEFEVYNGDTSDFPVTDNIRMLD
ncbi:MAG: hypothetical protein RLZZ414_491 [Bacteroidota bacterium]